MKYDVTIAESLLNLKNYIEKENYKGYDPYDGLKSPLLNLPFLKNSFYIRFIFQQLFKRLPFNLRPLFKIEKGINPVTLGLCIQAYSCMGKAGYMSTDETINRCENLIQKLKEYIPKGYHGACWGYDFPWQSRHFSAAAYEPSIVATGIITNGLFRYYNEYHSSNASDLCISASEFVLHDLNRIAGKDHSFCFSYTPNDYYPVFNASMKGTRLLAQVFSLTGNKSLSETAHSSLKYTMGHQKSDGSWNYAPGKKGRWIDNYHTGYILECAQEYSQLVNDQSFAENLEAGFNYYENNFLVNGCIPKFYNNRVYPIDCTSASQTIITLLRFGRFNIALQVAGYIISSMQTPEGNFIFRKHKHYNINQSYMRWSNAWMFAALAEICAMPAYLID